MRMSDWSSDVCSSDLIVLSADLDTAMATRTLLFAFGGSVQNEQGVVVLDSKHTLDAIKFMKELYQKTMTPQVMAWDASSNNRAMLSGTISLCLNEIGRASCRERVCQYV